MKIENIDINKIIPYSNNAKEHPRKQIDQIKASITEFGFNDPIAIDENNVIIEGHGRFIAIKELDYKKVPVIVLKHLTEIQKKQYILAHNKLTINTGFDEEILQLELEAIKIEDYDICITGFEDYEIKILENKGSYDIDEDGEQDIEDYEQPKKQKQICPHCGKVI